MSIPSIPSIPTQLKLFAMITVRGISMTLPHTALATTTSGKWSVGNLGNVKPRDVDNIVRKDTYHGSIKHVDAQLDGNASAS